MVLMRARCHPDDTILVCSFSRCMFVGISKLCVPLASVVVCVAASTPQKVYRHFDAGDLCQLATMPADLHNFVQTINCLFVQEPAGCMNTGFTAHMLESLRRPRAVLIAGRPKQLGGPDRVTQTVIRRCLARMCAWVRLSLRCMDYEYPHWHLLLSFSVFDLRGSQSNVHGFSEDFRSECFARLAAAFGGTPDVLERQHREHLSFAMSEWKRCEAKGFASAWAAAIKRPHGMRLPEDACLRRCIHALQAWDGFTSSEVERGFSAIRRVLGKHRDHLPDDAQSRVAKLAMDVPESLRSSVIKAARVIWLEYWGAARSSGVGRRNFSTARAKGTRQKTERAFIRERRELVRKNTAKNASSSRASVLEAAIASSASVWTAAHQAAESKLQSRAHHAKASALIGDNILLQTEVTDELRDTAKEIQNIRRRHDREHDRKRLRVEGALRPRPEVSLGDATVWFQPSLQPEILQTCRDALRTVAQEKQSADMHEADYFVVANVDRPNFFVSMSLCLLGGHLADPTYWVTGGHMGVSFTYANVGRRSLFLTPRFAREYPSMVDLVDKCLQSPKTKWKKAASLDVVVRYHERDESRPVRQRRPLEMIALVLKAEKRHEHLQCRRWAMTLDVFVQSFSKVVSSVKGVGSL